MSQSLKFVLVSSNLQKKTKLTLQWSQPLSTGKRLSIMSSLDTTVIDEMIRTWHHAWSGQPIRVWEWYVTSCSDLQMKKCILHTFWKDNQVVNNPKKILKIFTNYQGSKLSMKLQESDGLVCTENLGVRPWTWESPKLKKNFDHNFD